MADRGDLEATCHQEGGTGSQQQAFHGYLRNHSALTIAAVKSPPAS
jgi:hypothetical protein